MAGNKDINSDAEMTLTLPPYEKIRKPTMSETYQYFKKLIETESIKNLDECADSSIELGVFDESLQLLLINTLKLEEEVLKILLSQNESQIKGVLGFKWFFQNLSADFCTKQILPHVSLSLRCKIINRLSKHLESVEEAEKYYAFIRDNYDKTRANYMLPKCSPKFILAYVEREKPTFDYNTGLRVLQCICKRYPEIGVHILSTVFDMKKGDPYNYNNYKRAIHYLTGNHPHLMIPFIRKFASIIPHEFFGRNLTKKLVTVLREDLFTDFIKHLIFKERTLFSIIDIEDQAKFIAAIVRSQSEFLSSRSWTGCDERLARLLKLVPQDKRQDLIDKAFKELFNVNLMEYPKCWSSEVLETLPTETRLPYVAKLEEISERGISEFRKNFGYCSCFSPDNPEYYMYLYDSRVAFDKFREILRKTPVVSKRETILYQLVKSCWINKDLKVLEEVVEFVTTRHRNDDHTVIYRFMEAISDHFPVSSLNSTIFEKLDDLAYFCYMKGRKNDHVYNQWMERHIYHRLENGLDVDDHVKRFFESSFVKSYQYAFIRDFRSKYSKLLILLLSKEAAHWLQNKPTEMDTENCMLQCILNTCQEYNKLNGKERLFLREIPGLEEILRKKINESFGEVGGEEWSLDIWERYYSDLINTYYKSRSMFFIFKRQPDLIEKHLEGIIKIICSEYFRVYNALFIVLIKAVSFFGKTAKMKEIILNEFENGKSLDIRKTALLLYSHVCTIDEFNKVIESYLPKQEKLGRDSDEAFNAIQMWIPNLIKNIKPRHKNLQLVLKFFMGDFLKSVLPSFYTCCYSTRCDVVIPFLKKRLEEVPPKVSFVKDIIRLILLLSDKKGRTEFYLQCWDKHKHYSVRSIVLRFVSQFFLDERNRESFQILEKCILDCDEITISTLPELDQIPGEFLNDYVSALWRFSDAQKPIFRVNFRKGLLEGFTRNNINFLSKEFCESIIKSNLFEKSTEISVNDFAAVYLSAKSADVENRVFMVLNLIKDRRPDAQSVYNFLNILIGHSKGNPSEFADLFTVILKNWPEYPLGVLYELQVLYTYHNVYQNVLKRCGDGENTFVEFGKELKKLLAGVENLKDLLPIYVNCLKHFLGSYETSKVILALKELVTDSLDRSIAVLAVLCMPGEAVNWHTKKRINAQPNIVNSKKELEEFVKILEGYGDSIVQIYLRSKFEFTKSSFA